MKYFSFTGGRREAEQQLRELEQRIARGEISFSKQETSQITLRNGSKDMRVEELAHLHLEWVKSNKAAGTFINRRIYTLKFLEFMGPAMVSDVTRIKLEQFYMKMREASNKPNAGFEAMRHIRTLLRWGEETELVELPFKRFPKMPYTQPETRRCNSEDLGVYLTKAPQDFRDFIMFGILTGLRPSEMRYLEQDNILHDDYGTPYLFIEKNVKGATMTRLPKPRSVPLCKEAEAIAERQIMLHPQSPLIFLNEDGTPYTRYTLRDRLRRLAKSCGRKVIIPYGLRHTFASIQAAGGIGDTSLAQLMGHSSTRTLQRYVSNTTREHKEAMERTEKRLMGMLGITGSAKELATGTGEKLSPELSPLEK